MLSLDSAVPLLAFSFGAFILTEIVYYFARQSERVASLERTRNYMTKVAALHLDIAVFVYQIAYRLTVQQRTYWLKRNAGKIVRIAPNYYSIDDPDALKVIYGHGQDFVKSEWCEGWNLIPNNPSLTTLFSERDAVRHAGDRRKVSAMFSMSAMLAYEEFVENSIDLFNKKLTELGASGNVFNLSFWLQCFVFDVIGEITRFGFLDKGIDIGHTMSDLNKSFALSSYLGLFAHLRIFVLRLLQLFGGASTDYVLKVARENISEAKRDPKVTGDSSATASFLSKMVYAQSERPDKLPDWDVFHNAFTKIGAGSDTASISFTSSLYNVYRSPAILKKLREEVSAVDTGGHFRFKDAQNMPYLQAFIKEALRVHPAVGFPLSRKVLKGGAVISGQFFPENTNVGTNAWVVHRNRAVFGEDADEFRPERWLESQGERARAMDRSFMTFGAGSQNCLGRNISMLEVNKLFPVFVRDYDLEIRLGKDEGMSALTRWVAKPVDFPIRNRRRKAAS